MLGRASPGFCGTSLSKPDSHKAKPMRRSIQLLTTCVCGLLLLTGFGLRADEPATEATAVIETTAVVGLETYEDAGYARISRRDWTAPESRYLERSPVIFPRMYPKKFYGQHGPKTPGPVRRYSIIPLPTDTSQQGFYYMHVPSWQSRAGMLPPIPRPSRWHNRPAPPSARMIEGPPAAPNTQAQQQPPAIFR